MKINELIPLYSNTSKQLPAYRRVKDLIVSQIALGVLVPGAQIPSENEFVDALGISRMTVNRAMRELTAEGVLTRTRGIGTFVAEAKAPGALMEVHNIADEIQQRGHEHSTCVLALEEVYTNNDAVAGWAPGQIPAGLGTYAFHSVIIHYENGVPFQFEERFVSPTEAPHYLSQNYTKITPNDYLMRVAPLIHGKHIIEAVLASPEQCQMLQLDTGTPCLRIERYTYSETGLVSAARLLHPGGRIRLEGEFGN